MTPPVFLLQTSLYLRAPCGFGRFVIRMAYLYSD